MNDKFKSLDETLAGIREEYEAQLKAMGDALLAAQIEATMAKDQLKQAREAQASAERVTTKLLTQFGLVAQVFEEARAIALKMSPPPTIMSTKELAAEELRNPGSITFVKHPVGYDGRDFANEVEAAAHAGTQERLHGNP